MRSATDRSDIPGTARDRRLENFAAELTRAVYPLVLRRGPKDPWFKVELDLWRALAATVTWWFRQRPAAASADELETWREAFLVDLIDSACHIALRNGTRGSLLELELRLYQVIRLVMRRRGRPAAGERAEVHLVTRKCNQAG